MNEELEALLKFLAELSPVGAERVRAQLLKLAPKEQAELASYTRRSDALAYTWQGSWKQVARAWMLLQLRSWIGFTGWALGPDPEGELAPWLTKLSTAQESDIRGWITDALSGKRTIQRLALHQCNSDRQHWKPDHFTDPKTHNNSKFVYLVHAMRPSTGLPAQDESSKSFKYMREKYGEHLVKDTSGETPSWNLKAAELYLRNPKCIQSEMLSCSVISNERKKLYGDFCFGFILRAPCANICMGAPKDLAINNSVARDSVLVESPTPLARLMQVDDFVELLAGLYGQKLDTPSGILANSSGHNEIIVLGFAGTACVEIAGLFVKVTSANKLWAKFAAQDAQHGLQKLMLDCAQSLGVPIVGIQDDAVEGSSVDFDAWCKGATKTKSDSPPPPPSTPATTTMKPVLRSRESPIQFSGNTAVLRTDDVIREYLLDVIRDEAQTRLKRGETPEQVHRFFHDSEGVPHEVIEHVLNALGHRDYI